MRGKITAAVPTANPDMPPDVVEILERAVDITRLANDPIPLAVVRA
jgi:hypothetical protein